MAKVASCTLSFNPPPPLGHIRMGFGPVIPPYQGKEPTPHVGISPYPGTVSVPLFNLSMYINGLQTSPPHPPPQLSVLHTPWGWGAGVFPLQHWRVHTGQLSWVSCRGGPASPEGLMRTTGAGLTLSSLCQQNIIPSSAGLLFSLVTPIPRGNRQKCLVSSPGIEN